MTQMKGDHCVLIMTSTVNFAAGVIFSTTWFTFIWKYVIKVIMYCFSFGYVIGNQIYPLKYAPVTLLNADESSQNKQFHLKKNISSFVLISIKSYLLNQIPEKMRFASVMQNVYHQINALQKHKTKYFIYWRNYFQHFFYLLQFKSIYEAV